MAIAEDVSRVSGTAYAVRGVSSAAELFSSHASLLTALNHTDSD
jgi:hypothetical protein